MPGEDGFERIFFFEGREERTVGLDGSLDFLFGSPCEGFLRAKGFGHPLDPALRKRGTQEHFKKWVARIVEKIMRPSFLRGRCVRCRKR